MTTATPGPTKNDNGRYWLMRMLSTVGGLAIAGIGGMFLGHTSSAGHPVTIERLNTVKAEVLVLSTAVHEIDTKLDDGLSKLDVQTAILERLESRNP